MTLTVATVAQQIGGQVIGDGTVELTGFAPANRAQPGELTFADQPKYLAAAEQSQAAAILVSTDYTSPTKILIRVPDARVAMARALPLFFPEIDFPPGIDPTARIAADAVIDPTAHIGAHCRVEAGTRIGARSALIGGNHIERNCRIGDDVRLHPQVVLYPRTEVGNRVIIHAGTVIGSDGYGYVLDQGRHRKVLQVGNVVLQDDVEIGANAAIDRGTLGSTVIGAGTKIDNLVHVAHNVIMGRHCLIMGQVGFAGSTQLGDYCVVASQSGIAGHLKLGNQAMVGAKSGVMRDVADREIVLGIPAGAATQTKRQWVGAQQLPDMIKRLRQLEKQVAELAAAVGEAAGRDERLAQ